MKHEHILGIRTNAVRDQLASSCMNMLAPVGSVSIDPTQVVVGHREHLDNYGASGDPSVLQAIGYAVIHHPKFGYLVYQRKGAEGRLDGKISIGFGGHTSIADIKVYDDYPEEIDLMGSVVNGMYRELTEELVFTNGSIHSSKALGVILCDRTPVDLLHIGFVYQFELDSSVTDVALGDHGKEIFWVQSFNELNLERCEEWTKIVITAI